MPRKIDTGTDRATGSLECFMRIGAHTHGWMGYLRMSILADNPPKRGFHEKYSLPQTIGLLREASKKFEVKMATTQQQQGPTHLLYLLSSSFAIILIAFRPIEHSN